MYFNSLTEESYKYFELYSGVLDIETENTLIKLTAIMKYEEDLEEELEFKDSIVYKAIRKGFNRVFKCMQNRNICNIKEIVMEYAKNLKSEEFNWYDAVDVMLVVIQLNRFFNYQFDSESLEFVSTALFTREQEMYLYRDKDKWINNGENLIADVYSKDFLKKNKLRTIEKAVDYLYDNDDKIISNSMAYFKDFVNSSGVDIYEMTDVDFTEEDRLIMTTFLNGQKKIYPLDDSSKKTVATGILIILALTKKYKEAKKFTLNEVMKENVKKETKLKDELEELKVKYAKLEEEKRLADLKSKETINGLKRINSELTKNNTLLEQEINKRDDNSKEITALRDVFYSLDTKGSYDDEYATSDDIESLNTILKENNIVIVGGYEAWAKNLKKVLPDVNICLEESKNRKLDFLKKADMIILNPMGLSHGMYYKVIKQIRNTDVKLKAMGRAAVNIEKTVQEMKALLINTSI